ncbi:MAG: hypothetical protein K0M50_08290 [Prolixibacteraceae bacterium]|nr:hypothetical protein [Prolixibacteraceae bacterium]
MENKYLLYIDILGFSNLSSSNDNRIRKIYEIVDELNVHRHDAFDTFVFSDTILVANKYDLNDDHSHEYHVMYSCEFVQDLLYRSVANNLDIPFRAILSYNEFEYYKLNNIQCYHGQALINSYKKEKEINGIGLFIRKDILHRNKIFKTIEYDNELDYVFLNQPFDLFYSLLKGETPVPSSLFEDSPEFLGLPTDIDMIKSYYNQGVNNSDPKFRSKNIQTYQFFKTKYPVLVKKLESVDFSYSIINNEIDWEVQRLK